MAELYRSDAELTALSATTMTGGFVIPTQNADPHYVHLAKFWSRVADAMKVLTGMEVYKDTTTTYAVRAGKYYNGDTLVTYAGSTANALTASNTNYIYLTAAGVLTKNTSAFPTPTTTPCLPLATIAADADMYYSIDDGDLVDERWRALFHVVGNVRTPVLTFTDTDDADGTGTMEIQVQDMAGIDIAERYAIRTWIAASDFGTPAAQTDFSVTTGTEIQEVEANADYEVVCDATGLVLMNIVAADATYYVMAEVDGRIYSESIAITGN